MCSRIVGGLQVSLVVSVLALGTWSMALGQVVTEAQFRAQVEADWEAQEQRAGRSTDDPEAVCAAIERAGRLLDSLRAQLDTSESQQAERRLGEIRVRAGRQSAIAEERRGVYREARGFVRMLMVRHPRLAGRPIVFVKRHRFICQMLHEYLGYYYDYANLSGGGVFVLEEPGRSSRIRDLIGDRLPPGAYSTPAVSIDGQSAYFAYAPIRDVDRPQGDFHDWTQLRPATEVTGPLNYFADAGRATFHLYVVGANGGGLRPLTEGPDDDFGPCPMPDGSLTFLSTRRGGFCRCSGDFEPIPTYTLHRREPDGRVRTLSYHETNEWHPSLLADGRLVYSRWDYVDRSAAHFHGLWACNPDGSSPRVLFGNYTKQVSACYQPRSIPGSKRIAFIAGAHHAPVGGTLVLLDPSKASLDPATGEDRLESLEALTPEVAFPEAPGWPSSYYASPWPLSEDHYLVAYSAGALPGWGPKVTEDSETGLYYFDRFGNLELLYREAGIGVSDPIPLGPTEAPPRLASTLDPALGDEGEFLLTDVNACLMPLPAGRPIRELRVFQVLPKTTYPADAPPLGYAPQAGVRTLLGTVPVEADGSARFRAPARKPLYFQAVDADGRAVAGMRSVTYLQPGERQTCIGCHEPPQLATAASRAVMAARTAPSHIRPGPDGTRPWSYPRLVQPVLDRSCVPCHDGAKGGPVLSGAADGSYTRSYEALRPYVRWYTWIGPTIGDIVTWPGRLGADASPLSAVLDDPNHSTIALADEDRRRILLWLDANAPFYGTYDVEEQREQQQGRVIKEAQIQ